MEKGLASSSSSPGSGKLKSLNGPPSPAKKGRMGVFQSGQPPRCQVEGCEVDLSEAKSYYSRHKVCGTHSKSSMVIVAGLQQRFCQQCSRFHQLPEFDKGKRSCRRRLAGHNERRRKPPPGSLLPSGCGMFLWQRSMQNLVALLWTGKNQPPWLDSSLDYMPDLVQGSEDCFNGGSNSSSALSLLSNPPWNSINQPISHSAAMAQYACSSWSFKDNQCNNLATDMRPEDFSQTPSHHFTEELDLARQLHELEHSRSYDSSVQQVDWSL